MSFTMQFMNDIIKAVNRNRQIVRFERSLSMKKRIISFLAIILIVSMLLPSCTPGNSPVDTTTEIMSDSETESITEVVDTNTEIASDTEVESNTEDTSETESVTDDEKLNIENGELIESSNELANKVQAYFTDGTRTHFTVENTEMSMTYSRAASGDQLVSSIVNKNGASYITDTMDIFVKMRNGNTYYASDSGESAQVNLYRYGYYYYEALLEGQGFIPEDYSIVSSSAIDVGAYYEEGAKNIAATQTEEGSSFIITEANDPHISYQNLSFDTSKYNILILTAKTVGNISGLELFISMNSESYKAERSAKYNLINDGEFHTYYIILEHINEYKGTLTGLRFDPLGNEDSGIVIKDMQIAASKLDAMPQYVSISRRFHVYPDKMHHSVQFATTEATRNIAEVGIETVIDADTVAKILIKDANGEHDSLDGVDWTSVECVGFDIIDAGIFGYIMPADDIAGSICVTLENGAYKIVQSRVPENNTLIPSEDGTENANDFYVGQRVYTDENHDFEELLYESYCERNPISSARIRVSETTSDSGSYLGYDAMRGIYVFNIGTPLGGFYTPYNNPNRQYKVEFTVRADIDRDIYVMTSTTGHMLECAALMDENMLMMPVPIQVIKNFSETNGERNLYNKDDPGFSEAIFRLTLNEDERYTYNILNLYQNWGNYPLKQLSSIPFYCPYYHLSTGVTETNCITPWYLTRQVGKSDLNTLPDFRPMSAPYYSGQPQHHNSGSHSWLKYTDAEGNTYASENVNNTITSYGPTYAEVVMDYISDDGKIAVTYTHMEMPQTDENRTYYTMEYTVLEDITINDFKYNFSFYEMTDNDNTGVYQKIGYLDENNQSRVVAANKDSAVELDYLLGDNCPYFTFFEMPGVYDEENNPEGYSSSGGYGNLAFLIYNSKAVIGGEEIAPQFAIVNAKNKLRLSLNLDDVTLKAGDTVTINAILLPWGSHELNDGKIDVENGNYEYTMYLDEAQTVQYMDKNVRDVRENTLLNPLTVTSDTDEVLESVYLPKVKSSDGKTAEFTLSGGANNVAVRIYGFEMLTAPKIEEYIDGEWVEYVVSSSESPDRLGYYHYYDGYGVQYDGDGTFSYSFVTTMTDGASRRFRISADTEFKGWPIELPPKGNEDLLDVYVDAEEIKSEIDVSDFMFGKAEYNDEGYVSVYVKLDNDLYKNESYAGFYNVNADTTSLEELESGQYFVIKYRVPKTNTESVGHMQVWSYTINQENSSSANFSFNPKADGEWHVEVFDLSSFISSFTEQDGKYYAKYLRVDIYNKAFTDADTHIDIAYMGIDADLAEIGALCKDEFEEIPLYYKDSAESIDTATGEVRIVVDIDPESGYTKSDAAFGANLGHICGVKQNNFISHTKNGGKQAYSGATVDENYKIYLRGWCAVDGGVEKYVWSVDGLNWYDVGNTENIKTPTAMDIATTGQAYSGKNFGSLTDSSINAQFQANDGISIDLSEYKDKTVDVTFAAVPAADTSTLVLLYRFEKVSCKLDISEDSEEETAEPDEDIAFGANLGSINGVSQNNFISHTKNGGNQSCGRVTVDTDYRIYLRGWCAVDGGAAKYVYSVDGETWFEVGNTDNIKTPTALDIATTGQAYAGKSFADLEASSVNAQFQSNNGIFLDLSDFGTQTVDVTFAVVPAKNESMIIPLYRFENVECIPKKVFAFGANLGYINDVKQSNFISHTKNNGNQIYEGDVLVDENYDVFLKGWCAVDGGVLKYVWSVDGRKWFDVGNTENIKTPTSTAEGSIVATAQAYAGKTFDYIEEANTNAAFQANDGITINLSEYKDQTVDIIFAAVPVLDPEQTIVLYTFKNVDCTAVCTHKSTGDWYYYDDGDTNTTDALEAKDCGDCDATKVVTRKAAYKGYFMSIAGDSSTTSDAVMNIDLASKSVAPKAEDATLGLQLWLALGNGGYDNAYYKVTTENGTSEWLPLAARGGNGISNADAGTQTSLTNSGYDGANMGVIKTTLDLKEYNEQTVSITFAVVARDAADMTDKYIIFASFTNVVVPFYCAHENLSDWYYYDDGDANTTEALEARDCTDCEEKKIETRKAAYKGYFMSIAGDSSTTSDAVMNIDLASKSVAPKAEDATLGLQLWLALGNGGYDNAYYKVTTENGTSEWLPLAARGGNGISNADAGTQTSLTNSGYDGANMGVIKTTLDLKEYNEQTVSITFAVIARDAADMTDKYVTFASFTNVVVPKVDTRPKLEDIAFGANISNVLSHSKNGGNQSYTGKTVDENYRLTFSGWCAVDGGVSKYVWSVDGTTWYEEFGNSANIKTPSSNDIVNAGQSYSEKTFADIEAAKTNAQFQSGGIYVDLSAYRNQTVDVIFAAVPALNTDVKILLYTFEDIVCPPSESDVYYGSSIKVNGGSANTPSTKNGTSTVTGVTVDSSCLVNLNGWCAVDGGVSKYVWSVDGTTWYDEFGNSDRIKTTTTEAIVTTGQAYSGKTFTDLTGAYTNAQFQSGGIDIDLSAFKGQTVDVKFAAIPISDTDSIITLLTVEDVAVPAE